MNSNCSKVKVACETVQAAVMGFVWCMGQMALHRTQHRERRTRGLKAKAWESLGSTTDGYGSKITTFLGDSNAERHMDTSKSTTCKHTQTHNMLCSTCLASLV